MKAAVTEGYRQPLVIRELEEPPLPEHGARVRVMANGICRSDWHAWVFWHECDILPCLRAVPLMMRKRTCRGIRRDGRF